MNVRLYRQTNIDAGGEWLVSEKQLQMIIFTSGMQLLSWD